MSFDLVLVFLFALLFLMELSRKIPALFTGQFVQCQKKCTLRAGQGRRLHMAVAIPWHLDKK